MLEIWRLSPKVRVRIGVRVEVRVGVGVGPPGVTTPQISCLQSSTGVPAAH